MLTPKKLTLPGEDQRLGPVLEFGYPRASATSSRAKWIQILESCSVLKCFHLQQNFICVALRRRNRSASTAFRPGCCAVLQPHFRLLLSFLFVPHTSYTILNAPQNLLHSCLSPEAAMANRQTAVRLKGTATRQQTQQLHQGNPTWKPAPGSHGIPVGHIHLL